MNMTFENLKLQASYRGIKTREIQNVENNQNKSTEKYVYKHGANPPKKYGGH